MGYRYWITVIAGLLLGIIFLSSGIGKIIGHGVMLVSVANLTFFPHILQVLITDWLPWAEVVLGLALITGIGTQIVSLLSSILIACFLFQNSWMIAHGMSNEPCHCFGALERLFQGRLSTMNSLYIDIGMLALAITIYFCFQGGVKEWRPWFMRMRRKDEGAVMSAE
jgi:uncharacterized membrane protein YphA (DoxX/SURF4 family)